MPVFGEPQYMSVSYYYEIYCVDPNEVSTTFTDVDSFQQFRSTHEAKLTFEAQGGDVFTLLEECVRRLALAKLKAFDLNEFDRKFDNPELGEQWLKSVAVAELQGIDQDLSQLLEIARSTPGKLVFDHWQYADLRSRFEKDIALAATALTVEPKNALMYYDEGEFLLHFFEVVRTVRSILADAKASNQALLFAWYCCG
jgi:hypothetical protein